MNIPATLKFTDNHSFRLFTEGLQALQAYERSAKKDSLKKASTKLAECVANYNDVLPRLYLGIARTLEGYSGLDEALRLFAQVAARAVELRPTAKYNMAEAHVAKYREADFERADHLLTEVILDPEASAEDKLQAESLQTFIYVRQHLWLKRFDDADLGGDEKEAETRLANFKRSVDSGASPDSLNRGLLSDYWNIRGLMEEYRAHRAPDAPSKEASMKRSLEAFDESLKDNRNLIAVKSNKARVYQELAEDFETARQLFQEVLEVRDDSYAHYMLGKIYYHYENLDEAQRHYGFAAVDIPGAAFGLGQILEKLNRTDEALSAYARIPKDSNYFDRAQERIRSLS